MGTFREVPNKNIFIPNVIVGLITWLWKFVFSLCTLYSISWPRLVLANLCLQHMLPGLQQEQHLFLCSFIFIYIIYFKYLIALLSKLFYLKSFKLPIRTHILSTVPYLQYYFQRKWIFLDLWNSVSMTQSQLFRKVSST